MEIWKRNQYVVTATVFVVYVGFAFVLPFLPLYVRELGVRNEERAALWAGILIGIAPLIAGLLAPVWGRLADRLGQQRVVMWALLSCTVLLALSAAAQNVWQLLVLRAAIGVCGGIGPLGLAMATSSAPRDHTGHAVGLVQAAQILSAAAGPFMGGFLADTIGFRSTFLVTAGLCAVALLLVARFYVEPQRVKEVGERQSPASGLVLTGAMGGVLAVLFLVNFVGRSFTPILPLYLSGLGVARPHLGSATGALISFYSVAAAASATLFGRASRARSPQTLLALSLAGGAMLVLPMAVVTTFAAAFTLAILLGLVSGGALTLCYTMGGLLTSGDRNATAYGYFSGAALFGGAISPTVAGLIAHWNLLGIFYLDTVVFALLALALLPGRRRFAPST